uniref:CrV1-like protein n=1 Tax=Glyptapanteles indiensis TaxID=92994 RepID=A0JCU3_GLYIN|nr:CrV1-like protein [Glyptapanteles indiensis]
MSLNNSAFVLVSALFSLSCTQALPTHHQWEAIQENPVADPNLIDSMAKLYSTRSDSIADGIMPPQDDVTKSAGYNRGTSMILDSYPEVPPKRPYSENFLSGYPPIYNLDYDARSRFVDRPHPLVRTISEPEYLTVYRAISGPGFIAGNGAVAGNGVFAGNGVSAKPELFSTPRSIVYQPENVTEKTKSCLSSHEDLLSKVRAIEKALQELTSAITCNEDEVTSNTATTSSSPPVLMEATVKFNPETIKSSEKRVTTSKPATTTTSTARPLFPIDPDVAFELENDKSSEEKEAPLDTDTTTPSAPGLVPTEPNAAFELGPVESPVETPYGNDATAKIERPF